MRERGDLLQPIEVKDQSTFDRVFVCMLSSSVLVAATQFMSEMGQPHGLRW